MQRLIIPWRTAAFLTITVLTGCSPKSIDLKACRAGDRLAFEIADTKGWFSTSKARPWSASVYQRFVKSAWDTQVPHDLIQDRQHSFQPNRSIIFYGQRFDGWEIRQTARPLENGKEYLVEIWSDGGQGQIVLTAGAPLPACAAG